MIAQYVNNSNFDVGLSTSLSSLDKFQASTTYVYLWAGLGADLSRT
jgi:hypothetical protein